MIILLLTSFLAGILTILTPCSLPLLPIILAGSIKENRKIRPFIIISSLVISVFVFSLILKIGVSSLGFNPDIITFLAGVIIILLGLFTIFPEVWSKFAIKIKLEQNSSRLLNNNKSGLAGDILTGAALGPVFTSCSPMYGYILYAILPSSLFEGIIYLVSFSLGMGLFLLLISILGQKIINKTKWLANPNSRFKKVLGVIFVVIGLMIIFKIDKQIESFLLDQTFIQNLLLNKVEQNIINTL